MSLAPQINSVNKIPLIKDQPCQAVNVLGKRNFTNRELVDMFPEAKKTIIELIKEDEQALEDLYSIENKVRNFLFSKVKLVNLDLAVELGMCFFGEKQIILENELILCENNDGHYTARIRKPLFRNFMRGERVADRLERNKRLLALYKLNSKKNKTAYDNFQLQVEKARAYPIENLVQVNRAGWSKCPLHGETQESFHINKKKNVWYCFGCSMGGDVISLYMKMNGCSFNEAVNKLS